MRIRLRAWIITVEVCPKAHSGIVWLKLLEGLHFDSPDSSTKMIVESVMNLVRIGSES